MYITFPNKNPFHLRLLFTVEKIENDIIFLKRDNDETLQIDNNGCIFNHYKNGHKMIMTYISDKRTLFEIKKVNKLLHFKKKVVSLYRKL